MHRSLRVLNLAAATAVLVVAAPRVASACGGCFHPPTQTVSDITDERMLLAVSPQQTTLYDQLQYSGSPSSFAWVLPIHGTVDVGLSADILFGTMDTLTATEINPPAIQCPAPPSDCAANFAGSAPSTNGAAGGSGGVTVTKAENVGPYATVQLHATDSSALDNWLQQNGYNIPADVLPTVNAYVNEGFDFLAMKLLPNQGVQAMRPVRVTTPGASLSLPLRMAAVGTGATIGITIWVVSDGRYQPQNFPFFHIEDSQLVWDFSTSSSNYTTLRAQNEAALSGKGWEIESSIDLNEQLITNVIFSGGQYYGGGGVGSAPVADPSEDYLAVGEPEDGGAGGDAGDDAGPQMSADQVRTQDVADLFVGMMGPSVRVTRIRSDISHAAMTQDFVIEASSDQSELSNVRQVTTGINYQCPIYDNCTVVGTGSPAQAAPTTGSSSAGAPFYAAKGGEGGCVAAPKAPQNTGIRLSILGGMLGLSLIRLVRSRRRK